MTSPDEAAAKRARIKRARRKEALIGMTVGLLGGALGAFLLLSLFWIIR